MKLKEKIENGDFILQNYEPKKSRFVRSKQGHPCLFSIKKKSQNFVRITTILNNELEESTSIFSKPDNSKQLRLIDPINNKWILKIFEDENGIKFSLLQILYISPYENFNYVIPVLRGDVLQKDLFLIENKKNAYQILDGKTNVEVEFELNLPDLAKLDLIINDKIDLFKN